MPSEKQNKFGPHSVGEGRGEWLLSLWPDVYRGRCLHIKRPDSKTAAHTDIQLPRDRATMYEAGNRLWATWRMNNRYTDADGAKCELVLPLIRSNSGSNLRWNERFWPGLCRRQTPCRSTCRVAYVWDTRPCRVGTADDASSSPHTCSHSKHSPEDTHPGGSGTERKHMIAIWSHIKSTRAVDTAGVTVWSNAQTKLRLRNKIDAMFLKTMRQQVEYIQEEWTFTNIKEANGTITYLMMLFSDLEVVCHKRFLSTNPNMSIKQYRPVKAAETANEGRSVQHDVSR